MGENCRQWGNIKRYRKSLCSFGFFLPLSTYHNFLVVLFLQRLFGARGKLVNITFSARIISALYLQGSFVPKDIKSEVVEETKDQKKGH